MTYYTLIAFKICSIPLLQIPHMIPLISWLSWKTHDVHLTIIGKNDDVNDDDHHPYGRDCNKL